MDNALNGNFHASKKFIFFLLLRHHFFSYYGVHIIPAATKGIAVENIPHNYFKMTKEKNRTLILHDLVLIHRERLMAYEQLVKWVKNAQVSDFLYTLADECRCNILQLHSHMGSDLGDPASRMQLTGVIYQQWPGIKPVLPGCSEQELLAVCRENEKMLYDIYKKLLRVHGIFNTKGKKLLALHFATLHKTVSLLHNFYAQPAMPMIRKDRRISITRGRGVIAE